MILLLSCKCPDDPEFQSPISLKNWTKSPFLWQHDIPETNTYCSEVLFLQAAFEPVIQVVFVDPSRHFPAAFEPPNSCDFHQPIPAFTVTFEPPNAGVLKEYFTDKITICISPWNSREKLCFSCMPEMGFGSNGVFLELSGLWNLGLSQQWAAPILLSLLPSKIP